MAIKFCHDFCPPIKIMALGLIRIRIDCLNEARAVYWSGLFTQY